MKIFFGIILIICLLLSFGCEEEQTNLLPPTGTMANTPTTTSFSKAENEMKSLIAETLGTCNREGIPKVRNIDIVNAGYGYNLDIHYSIDDNLTEGFIKGGARYDVLDVMEVLYTSSYDIQWTDMYGYFSMVDDFGEAREMEVIHARLGEDTAAKIIWNNITADSLFNILDYKNIHPAFQ